MLDRIEDALEDLRAGKVIIVVDVHGNEESYEKDKKMCNYDGSYAGCITAEYGSLGSRG